MIFALCGSSMSGKTTAAKRMEETGLAKRIVTYTTRTPRENEVNGIDYHFVSRGKFKALILEGFFIEYSLFDGVNFYGAPANALPQHPNDEPHTVILDESGIKSLRSVRDDVFVIYFDINNQDNSERCQRDTTEWLGLDPDFTVSSFDEIESQLFYWLHGLCG